MFSFVSPPSGDSGAPAVLLAHGLLMRGAVMMPLALRLRRAGFHVFVYEYASTRGTLAWHAERLRGALGRVLDACGGEAGIVAHSMGGLVARLCLAGSPRPRVRRMVMIAPPNEGSPVPAFVGRLAPPLWRLIRPLRELDCAPSSAARRLPVPEGVSIGVVAGDRPGLLRWPLFDAPNDGTVAVAATRLDAPHEHVVVPASHTFMLFRRDVARLCEGFLRHGRFPARPDAAPARAGSTASVPPSAA